jgi:hypothetical protein
VNYARLQGARLNHAHLEGITARQVRFEEAQLYLAHLEAGSPADLSFSSFDGKSQLDKATLANKQGIGPRLILRRQGIRKWPTYLGSLFLWALTGYGYRIWRIFVAYALVLVTFAAIYFAVGIPSEQGLSTLQALANALS